MYALNALSHSVLVQLQIVVPSMKVVNVCNLLSEDQQAAAAWEHGAVHMQ